MASAEVTRGVPERERTLPVPVALGGLWPDAGLVRGRVLACRGPAGTSLAFAAIADAVAAGSWLAVVSVPGFGVDAALGLGLDPARLVRVEVPDPARWVEVIAASLDGFDVVVTVPPVRLAAGAWRKVQARVRSTDAVLVTIGDHRVVTGDIELRTSRPMWLWARAHSHLLTRRLHVEVAGRRVPRPQSADLWLPAEQGGIASAERSDGDTANDATAHAPTTRRRAG